MIDVGIEMEDVDDDVDGIGITGTGIDDVKTILDGVAMFERSGTGVLKFVDSEIEDSDETMLDVGTGSGNEVEDGTIDGAILEMETDWCPEDDEVGVEGGELSSEDSSEEIRMSGISRGKSTGSGLLDGVNSGVPEPDTSGSVMCESKCSGTSNAASS
jgi:hypothetical protein